MATTTDLTTAAGTAGSQTKLRSPAARRTLTRMAARRLRPSGGLLAAPQRVPCIARATPRRRTLSTFSEATSATVGSKPITASGASAGGKGRSGCPSLILGTMTFGWSKASQQVDDIEAWKMVRAFQQEGGGACCSLLLVPSGSSAALDLTLSLPGYTRTRPLASCTLVLTWRPKPAPPCWPTPAVPASLSDLSDSLAVHGQSRSTPP